MTIAPRATAEPEAVPRRSYRSGAPARGAASRYTRPSQQQQQQRLPDGVWHNDSVRPRSVQPLANAGPAPSACPRCTHARRAARRRQRPCASCSSCRARRTASAGCCSRRRSFRDTAPRRCRARELFGAQQRACAVLISSAGCSTRHPLLSCCWNVRRGMRPDRSRPRAPSASRCALHRTPCCSRRASTTVPALHTAWRMRAPLTDRPTRPCASPCGTRTPRVSPSRATTSST